MNCPPLYNRSHALDRKACSSGVHQWIPCKALWRSVRNMEMNSREQRSWADFVQLRTSPTRYLEYGAGGSTRAASWRALLSLRDPRAPPLRISAVENSLGFMQGLLKERLGVYEPYARNAAKGNTTGAIAAAAAKGLLTLHFANTGETCENSFPCAFERRPSRVRVRQAAGYVQAADPLCEPTKAREGSVESLRCAPQPPGFVPYDVVLIDGRFRFATALHVLRVVSQCSVVLIHDFYRRLNASSTGYAGVFEYYDELRRVDNLAVLRPRPSGLAAARACYSQRGKRGCKPTQFERSLMKALYIPA